MSRRNPWAIVPAIVLLAAGSVGDASRAQETSSVPDVPAGSATIRGRVVHADDPAAAAGVGVILYAIAATGEPGIRRATTDAEGAFAFENVSNDPHTTYLVGARYRDVPFPGEHVRFGPGETERTVTVAIAEPTQSAAAISVAASRLRLDRRGPRLVVTETHRIENTGSTVFYAPSETRGDGVTAPVRIRLPEAASDFTLPYPYSPEGLVQAGQDVFFWGPLYPGTQEISFAYSLPIPVGPLELRKVFPSGTAQLEVLLREQGIEAKGSLPAGESIEIEGLRYRTLDGGAIDPSGDFTLTLAFPPAHYDPAAFSVAQVRMFLEADDAVLDVTEEYRVAVDGDSSLASESDTPLLRIPLPADARDLGFSANAFDVGLSREADGVAVYGPLPPGQTLIQLHYFAPATPDGVEFERRFGAGVPIVELYIADTGLETQSARMHRRRPVRSEDRTYIHLEAFQIDPGEAIRVALRPLERTRPLPWLASAGFVIAGALATIAFLVAPLRAGSPDAPAAVRESSARRELEGLYAAIHDLDHDHETGKLDDADYAELRNDLRGEALTLLDQLRRGAESAAQEAATADNPPLCPSCDKEVPVDARFCPQCGRPLGLAPGTDRGDPV